VTLIEVRALQARTDPGQLRRDAGIRRVTVATALGVSSSCVHWWESGACLPSTAAGFRWAAFTAGLERHAEVTAAMSMSEAA
jgi:DNA-binding XRE family transcriptional regulator